VNKVSYRISFHGLQNESLSAVTKHKGISNTGIAWTCYLGMGKGSKKYVKNFGGKT
jgi:hypothetical protein